MDRYEQAAEMVLGHVLFVSFGDADKQRVVVANALRESAALELEYFAILAENGAGLGTLPERMRERAGLIRNHGKQEGGEDA